jgi:hypothetical protein
MSKVLETQDHLLILADQEEIFEEQWTPVYTSLLHDKHLSLYAKMVQINLLSYCMGTSQCWPSLTSMCDDLTISLSTARRALTDLERAGWLKRHKRVRDNGSQTSNLYIVRKKSPNPRWVNGGGNDDSTTSPTDGTPLPAEAVLHTGKCIEAGGGQGVSPAAPLQEAVPVNQTSPPPVAAQVTSSPAGKEFSGDDAEADRLARGLEGVSLKRRFDHNDIRRLVHECITGRGYRAEEILPAYEEYKARYEGKHPDGVLRYALPLAAWLSPRGDGIAHDISTLRRKRRRGIPTAGTPLPAEAAARTEKRTDEERRLALEQKDAEYAELVRAAQLAGAALTKATIARAPAEVKEELRAKMNMAFAAAESYYERQRGAGEAA